MSGQLFEPAAKLAWAWNMSSSRGHRPLRDLDSIHRFHSIHHEVEQHLLELHPNGGFTSTDSPCEARRAASFVGISNPACSAR
jgi:hypothetical protein